MISAIYILVVQVLVYILEVSSKMLARSSCTLETFKYHGYAYTIYFIQLLKLTQDETSLFIKKSILGQYKFIREYPLQP
jgi:hypothetical protein